MKTAWVGSIAAHAALAGGLLWVAVDQPFVGEIAPAGVVTVALVEASAGSQATATVAAPSPIHRPARAEPGRVMPNRPESNPLQPVSAETAREPAASQSTAEPPASPSTPALSIPETDTAVEAIAAPPAGGTVGASSDPWPAYYAAVRDAVERVKRYPFSARLSGLEDRVAVNFFIAADGAAREIRLTEPSRFPILNDAALDTIRRVARFPAPPLRESQSGVRVTVPLEFTLHNHQGAQQEAQPE
ncbi:MAG: energy transducer TonB [Nitrospirae bacterium]|nr:energy transducer TonB [Nitrospirota bacterium]